MRTTMLLFRSVQIALLSFFILFIASCQRELKDPNPGSNPNPNPPSVVVNDNEMVTAGVRGIVVDENNQPVLGATVSSGVKTTSSDRYGTFRFNNISLSKANGTVKVSKPGYFAAFRTFISTAGRIHNVRIKLLPKTNAGNFSGTTGGTINITGSGKLVMPANAVTDASGTAYSGEVNVAMTWIDPTSADLPNIVPGDLRGITTTGEERGLQTFGMLGVELTGSSGQVLKIASGKTAELSFPIPASLQSNAPATIDLWNFNEATARWKQEGTATKNGSNYIAQVSHFSFWNCDAPFPLVDVCMTIQNAGNNEPLNNIQVRIKRPNGSYGYGRTDSIGNLCGKFPKNEALVLEVMSHCNTVAYSQNIGPFSSNTSIGNIAAAIPVVNKLIISGTLVNCSNANVTHGAAVVYTGNGHSYSAPVSNGTFSLTLIRCEGGTINFSVLGVDYTVLQQSNPVSGSGTTGTVNVGTLQACGTSSAEFVEFMIDGIPNSYASPPDNIFINDSLFAGQNNATVFASKATGGSTNNAFSSFSFQTNGSPGVSQLQSCRVVLESTVTPGSFITSETIVTANPTINITAFGPPLTGFVEGNFNIQMNFGGTTKNVVCTFRIRRQ